MTNCAESVEPAVASEEVVAALKGLLSFVPPLLTSQLDTAAMVTRQEVAAADRPHEIAGGSDEWAAVAGSGDQCRDDAETTEHEQVRNGGQPGRFANGGTATRHD